MASHFDGSGLLTLARKLRRFAAADFAPLMEEWEEVIQADNERGVLAGLDKDGQPLAAVTYRPVPPRSGRWSKKKQKVLIAGFTFNGPFAAGLDNNLTTSQYRHMSGPPLAPRRKWSRVVTNLVTRSDHNGKTWFAEAQWVDVVSKKGVAFLPSHFDGLGQKKRDLRGVRPEGLRECRTLLGQYLRWLWKGS